MEGKSIEKKFVWGDEQTPRIFAGMPKREEVTEKEFDDYIKRMTNSADLIQVGNYIEMLEQKEDVKAMGFPIRFYKAGEDFYFTFKRNPNS